MVPLGFDQTNGKAPGLEGDDGGVIAPVAERSVEGVLQRLMGGAPATRGASAVDRDPSVTPYSEEGAL
jgi:hypothetical protein